MKTLSRISFLFALIVFTAAHATMAQRVIKGTVYIDGEPASGITVEAHKGSTMMTSFDGKYEVTADPKSKYIKFTSLATGESKKFDLVEGSVNEIDFAFTGALPGAGAGVATPRTPRRRRPGRRPGNTTRARWSRNCAGNRWARIAPDWRPARAAGV